MANCFLKIMHAKTNLQQKNCKTQENKGFFQKEMIKNFATICPTTNRHFFYETRKED